MDANRAKRVDLLNAILELEKLMRAHEQATARTIQDMWIEISKLRDLHKEL